MISNLCCVGKVGLSNEPKIVHARVIGPPWWRNGSSYIIDGPLAFPSSEPTKIWQTAKTNCMVVNGLTDSIEQTPTTIPMAV